MKKSSEFGKGCAYNIALFIAHENLHTELFMKKECRTSIHTKYADNKNFSKMGVELWFNASSDHLYDLQIPKQFPSILKSRLKKFQSKCLHLGHGFPEKHATLADYKWAIKEGKALLRSIDKQLGIESTQGDWE
jgi:hypothetical protein